MTDHDGNELQAMRDLVRYWQSAVREAVDAVELVHVSALTALENQGRRDGHGESCQCHHCLAYRAIRNTSQRALTKLEGYPVPVEIVVGEEGDA